VVFSAVLMLLGSSVMGRAAGLSWNTNRNSVTADVRSGKLERVLQQVAQATGWRVFVEPDTSHTVSAKFENVSPGEALRKLLGDLNFALVPGTNTPSRLFVFRTTMLNATLAVAPAKNPVIPDELVVRLKPGVKIEDVAGMLGGKVVGGMEGLNTYRLRFEDETAADSARDQLSTLTEVASVENNYSVQRPPQVRQVIADGIPPISLQMKAPTEGGRIIIGLIDTAVQPPGGNLDAFLLKQISVAGPAALDPEMPSHGTTMYETMLRSLQAASKGSTSVQILPVDVYGPNSSTSTFDVANGIVQAVNNGARIINLSLGSEMDTPILRDVIHSAREKNVLIYAAAGNEPVTTPYYPAAYPEVTAVTAVEQGQVAPYANRGSFVALGAPGTSVVYYNNQPFYVTGTSAASAFTSGLAAGYMEATGSAPKKVDEFLRSTYGLKAPSNP
jgi:hypothetical protein